MSISDSESGEKIVSHLKLVETVKPESPEPPDSADDSSNVVHVWETKLLRSGKKSPPRKILANAIVPVRYAPEFREALRFNAFSLVIMIDRPLPWDDPRADFERRMWGDLDTLKYMEWLQKRVIDVNKATVMDAVYTVAREREYHPIRDWFAELKWDGVPRIDTWLSVYYGTEDSAYTRMVGPKYLISMVARIMKPGCKADCMLMPIGNQGQGKSTLLEVLVGKIYFTDEIKAVSGNKDVAIALTGKWLVEFADLEGFRGRDANDLKAFISRTTDRYRPPYGKHAEDYPRQCVFVGTTNQETPLKDFTGNRRYWPVHTSNVDITAMRRDREQLWAEAVARYAQGEAWWLATPEERALADQIAQESLEIDVWQSLIEEELEGVNETTMDLILEEILDLDLKKVTRRDQMRVANALQALGWVRVRGEDPKTKRRVWKYQRESFAAKQKQAFSKS